MAVGGSKMAEVKETINSLECGPGTGKSSPVKGGKGAGPGPSFKVPSRKGGKK